MKKLILTALVTLISSYSFAGECTKPRYSTVTGEESHTIYESLKLEEKQIEYCGPYSGNCPTFLGKEMIGENLKITCFKTGLCFITICEN